VTTNLDTLATALYVRTDDLLKESPDRAPWRPAAGIATQISDAELVTLAVMQALLGFTSEARWLRHARIHLRGLFPYLPGQPGYNKRLRALAATMSWLIAVLARDTRRWGRSSMTPGPIPGRHPARGPSTDRQTGRPKCVSCHITGG
jgi:hypothetical protein